MRTLQRSLFTLFCCGLVSLLTLGCATSSHKSVHTYDYNDQGRPVEKPAAQAEAEEAEGEYHMVSPGQMVVEPKKK